MRNAVLALVVFGCRADAAPAAGQPPATIELLHAVDARVTLSSQVVNATIKPEHLADRDLQTAWNSRTGDLVGAWIEIELPPKVVAKQIRMTIGHTGTGPRREDWFTMNPRIHRVGITSGGVGLPAHTFELSKRDLQIIDLGDKGSNKIRIEVQDIEPGSKKSWREICVSELEVWGTAPPELVRPDHAPSIIVDLTLAADALCDTYRAADAAYNRETDRQNKAPTCPTCVDGPSDLRGTASCDVAVAKFQPSGKWRGVAVRCHVENSHQGDKECTFAFLTDKWWLGSSITTRPYRSFEIVDATVGSKGEILVHYRDGDVDRSITCMRDETCTEKP
jgi:hypothetical protein